MIFMSFLLRNEYRPQESGVDMLIIYLTELLIHFFLLQLVNDLINILNPSKSGPNSIPIKLLKILGSSIAPLLAVLVNQSFQSGIFQTNLR